LAVKRRWWIGLALVGAAAAVAWLLLREQTWTLALTQAEIEAELGKRFPLQKTHLLVVGVTYSNPRVKLTDGSSEIGLGVDARLTVAGTEREFAGSADLVAKLAYDAANATFVLHDARVMKLRIDGLEAGTLERVRTAANALATESVAGIPVYKLRANDVKKTLTRLVLRSVAVRGGVLYIELGL
jgi:hypothetical protein